MRGRSKNKKILLGDSLERHDSNDWPWDMCEEDWDGMMDRVQKNNMKKLKEKKWREEKIEKAALVVQCMVGLGPIKQQSFNYFNKIMGNFSEAKKMAAVEYLTDYLKFSHNDMSDIDINNTKISPKGDDILYAVFDCPEKAKNIRCHIADCRNLDIQTCDYIPLQFYKRY